MQGEVALLLPRHGNDHLGCEKALVRVDEFAAGLADLIVAVGIDVDHLHGAEDVAGFRTVVVGCEGGFGYGDDAGRLSRSLTGGVRQGAVCGGGGGGGGNSWRGGCLRESSSHRRQ